MNNVENRSVQKRMERMCHGWAKSLGVVALSATFLWSPVSVSSVRADDITQFQLTEWLAAASGVKGLKTKNDYINWARAQGLSPANGWDANKTLTKKDMAQTIGQLLGVNANKYGGDYVRALQREGFDFGGIGDKVSRNELADFLDEDCFKVRLFQLIWELKHWHAPPKPPHHPPPPPPAPPVLMCHKGHTILVKAKEVAQHLRHGDTLGPCHVTKHGHDRDDCDDGHNHH